MVKRLDDSSTPPLLTHIGWSLWRASDHWLRAFRARMVGAGYSWFSEARANVIPHIDRAGTQQAVLAERMGLSKQAIQQFVDGLVADGVVQRTPDPADARARIVTFTPEGLSVLAAANRAKKSIEADYATRLGKARFDQLSKALVELNESLGDSTDE
ncbi:MAG: MarR family winged helix-turn-helix transcriptional regulator [Vicinamibacteria bacterium]